MLQLLPACKADVSSSMTRGLACKWQDVLDMLSEFAEYQAEGGYKGTDQMLDLLREIEHMPQQSTATWKHLLQDMRVG